MKKPGSKRMSVPADLFVPVLSTLEPAKVFEEIADKVCRLSGADASSVVLFDDTTKRSSLVASHNLEKPDKGEVLSKRRWRSIRGVSDLRGFLLDKGEKGGAKWAEEENLASLVYLPIADSEGLCGALNLYYRSSHQLTKGEKETLASFARYAGVAIENARRHQKTAERMEESTFLYEVSTRLISALDIGEVLHEILRAAQERFGYLDCSILLLDEDKDELYIRAARGYSEEVTGKIRPKMGKGITGWVAKTGLPLIVPDVGKEPRYIRGMEEAKSEIAVPMKIGDKIMGVLDAESDQPDAFKERDLRLLSSLAAQASLIIDRARLYQGLERRAKELDLLNQIANYLSSGLSFEGTLNQILDGVKRLIDYHTGRIYLLDRTRQVLVPMVVRYDREEYPYPYTQLVKKMEVRLGEGMTGWVAQHNQPVVIGDAERDSRVLHIPGAPYRDESLLAVPLLSDGKAIGVITLSKLGINQFGGNELRLLTILANQAAIAIENARLYEETKHLTNIDSLTGLYNSGYFHDALEKEIAKIQRYNGVVSLVILDVDNFKWCNDSFGHQVGDAVLCEIGEILYRLSRKADTAARYGGEEFAIILPHTPIDGAIIQAERIRSEIEAHPFWSGNPSLRGKMTISAGVAAYPADGSTAKSLIHAADMALYEAKAAGKNRVCCFTRDQKERAKRS